MELKKQNDDKLVELAETFATKNLDDRDNVTFDFEADIKRLMKKVNLTKLIKKDKKYLKKIKSLIMDIVLQRYLKDIINVGEKKTRRFKRLYA